MSVNSIYVTHVNQTFGASWLTQAGPGGGIVMGRLINVGAQLTY